MTVETHHSLGGTIPLPEFSGADLAGEQALQRRWSPRKARDNPALITPSVSGGEVANAL